MSAVSKLIMKSAPSSESSGITLAMSLNNRKPGETMTMIQQYHAAKQTHPNMLLLFRVGDEYHLLDEDAKTVATFLGLTMTTCDDIAMATFPHGSLQGH